jgi:hypothetical protein
LHWRSCPTPTSNSISLSHLPPFPPARILSTADGPLATVLRTSSASDVSLVDRSMRGRSVRTASRAWRTWGRRRGKGKGDGDGDGGESECGLDWRMGDEPPQSLSRLSHLLANDAGLIGGVCEHDLGAPCAGNPLAPLALPPALLPRGLLGAPTAAAAAAASCTTPLVRIVGLVHPVAHHGHRRRAIVVAKRAPEADSSAERLQPGRVEGTRGLRERLAVLCGRRYGVWRRAARGVRARRPERTRGWGGTPFPLQSPPLPYLLAGVLDLRAQARRLLLEPVHPPCKVAVDGLHVCGTPGKGEWVRGGGGGGEQGRAALSPLSHAPSSSSATAFARSVPITCFFIPSNTAASCACWSRGFPRAAFVAADVHASSSSSNSARRRSLSGGRSAAPTPAPAAAADEDTPAPLLPRRPELAAAPDDDEEEEEEDGEPAATASSSGAPLRFAIVCWRASARTRPWMERW